MRLWKFCSAHHKVGVERDSFKLKNANASEDGGCVLAVLGVNRGEGLRPEAGRGRTSGRSPSLLARGPNFRNGPVWSDVVSRLLCCLYRQQRHSETAFQGLLPSHVDDLARSTRLSRPLIYGALQAGDFAASGCRLLFERRQRPRSGARPFGQGLPFRAAAPVQR
jgi:hypothetical protein